VSAFLDEVLQPFYEPCPTSADKFSFGQIFRTPAYYPQQTLEVWRPKNYDPKLGIAQDFEIKNPTDIFKKMSPYSVPRLRTNEEFLVMRSKPRPVMLVKPPDPMLLKLQGARPGRITRHICTVALIYRLHDETGAARFPAEVLERIRRLEYPQFLYLPKGGKISEDSLARFDEIQSVALAQLTPTGYSLSSDAVAIARSQVSFHLTGLSGKEFADWAEQLRAG
jgi:hypothetical protein